MSLLLLLGLLLPIKTLSAEMSTDTVKRLEVLAESALETETAFRGAAWRASDLNSWLWLENSSEQLNRFRQLLPAIVRRRAALPVEINRCQRQRCDPEQLETALTELIFSLELQSAASDAEFQKALVADALTLRALGLQLVRAPISSERAINLALARAVLASTYDASGRQVRADLVTAIEGARTHSTRDETDTSPFPSLVAQADVDLEVYEATAQMVWLTRALDQVQLALKQDSDQAQSARSDATRPALRAAQVRFASVLLKTHALTGVPLYRDRAAQLLDGLANKSSGLDAGLAAGILAGVNRLTKQPLHITIVAPRHDAAGRELYEQALAVKSLNRHIEWLDRSQGPLKSTDVRYPVLTRPAAFVCVEKRCSLPVFTPSDLPLTIARMYE